MERFFKVGFVLIALALLSFNTITGAGAADYLAVVSAADGGSVKIFDPATGAPVYNASMNGLGGTEFCNFGGDGKLYVNRYQDSTGTDWDVASFTTGTWAPLVEFASLASANRMCTSVRRYTDGNIYMATVGGVVYKSNTAGAEPTGLWGGLGGDVRGLTIGPDGTLYLCSNAIQGIVRVSTQTGTRLPDYPVTGYPYGVTVGPDATGDSICDLYVGYWGQSVIDIYNGATGAKFGVFDDLANYGHSGAICLHVVFSKDGNTAYFTDWSDGIVFKKVGSAAATEFITGVSHPRGLDLSDAYVPVDNSDFVAVASGGSGGSVAIYNSVTGAVINDTSMVNLGAVMDVNFGTDGNLYVNRYLSMVEVGWDIARFPVGAWSPLEEFVTLTIHRCVSVKYWDDNSLYYADDRGVVFRSQFPEIEPDGFLGGLGGEARGITIGPDGTLYLCSAAQSWIARLNMPTNTRLTDIPVTGAPNAVSFGPDATGDGASDLYVGYWGQSVIDIYNSVTGAKVGVFDDLANYGYADSNCLQATFSKDGTTAYMTDWNHGIVYKKVGTAPAVPFIVGLSHPRSVALRNSYGATRHTDTILDVKQLPNETPVVVSGMIVTHIFEGDYFFIENKERTAGIRCYRHIPDVQIGDEVEVQGVIRDWTPDGINYTGERFIFAQNGNVFKTPGTELEPLFMTNKTLGGGDLGVAPNYQQGVVNGSGPNNIGLYIKTTGLVSNVDTSLSMASFEISDGSGVTVTALLDVGVAAPSNDAYIQVTGISSCMKNIDNQLERHIVVKDWQVVAAP